MHSLRMRFEYQNCCFFLVIGWSTHIKAIQFRRPKRGAGPRSRGNLPDQFIMVDIFLLLAVHEPHFKSSAPRGIHTLTSGVLHHAVTLTPALPLRNVYS